MNNKQKPLRVVSAGRIASFFYCDPATVVAAAKDLKISVAVSIDDREHYNKSDIDRIGARVREMHQRRQGKAAPRGKRKHQSSAKVEYL